MTKTKKIYILMGNPDKEGTLSAHIADVYETSAKTAGHEVRRTNIGDLTFDPILHKGYRAIQELEPDLKKVQEDMQWCEHFVLVYPLWWAGTPALLKGLIDRIFLPRFAFHFHKDGLGWDKMLSGRTARVIIAMKSHPFLEHFMFGDVTNEVGKAVLGFAGFKVSTTEIGNSEKLRDGDRTALDKRIDALGKRGV